MQPAIFGERVLVEISHAVERFALGADPGERIVVIAMFQRLPSWPAGHVEVLRDEACARIGRLERQYPSVPLPAVGAALVTRERPLPLDRLVAQVEGRVVEAVGG